MLHVSFYNQFFSAKFISSSTVDPNAIKFYDVRNKWIKLEFKLFFKKSNWTQVLRVLLIEMDWNKKKERIKSRQREKEK